MSDAGNERVEGVGRVEPPKADLWDADPLDGATAGRGEEPPEELQSFNTVGHLGPAGDIEGAQRAGRAAHDHLRRWGVLSWRQVVPWAAGAVLFVVFVLPALLG